MRCSILELPWDLAAVMWHRSLWEAGFVFSTIEFSTAFAGANRRCWRLFAFVRLEKQSPCKVNLLLNILGKRSDGFHALETVMHPVNLFDRLSFIRAGAAIELTCNHPELPCDSSNLVYRAAESFRQKAGIKDGI